MYRCECMLKLINPEMLQEASQCGQVKMPWMWETGPGHHSFMFRCAYVSSKLIKLCFGMIKHLKEKKTIKVK